MNWEKFGSIQAYTVQDQHFKIQILNVSSIDVWERIGPNLIFNVERKMRNLHKKKDGHILNLT